MRSCLRTVDGENMNTDGAKEETDSRERHKIIRNRIKSRSKI